MALYDPPRHDTKETIEASLELGVDVKMVTGDHLLVAKETARQLGLGTKIHGPEDFKKAQARGEKFCQNVVFNADGFAQVMPEDKYYIVEKLQQRGHITGMTGDGVNDAPALKLADCGIAVAGATDAARAAADIVLLSPGLSTITEAIMRARKIFQRLKNYVIYRINATVQILIFMSLSVLFLNEYYYENDAERELHHLDTRAFRLPAIVLVLIAIVNDFTIMSIAYDNVFPSPEPEKWHLKQTCAVACTLGLYGVLEVYLVYVSCKPSGEDNTSSSLLFNGREMWNKTHAATFLALAVGGQLSVFAARTHKFFFSRRPGYCLMTAVFGAFLINLVLGSTDALWTGDQRGCEVKETAIIVGYLMASFLLKDLLKVIAYSLLQYDPFKSWQEEEVGRQTNQRTAARQMSIYGTLDPERISANASVRSTRELYRSISRSSE